MNEHDYFEATTNQIQTYVEVLKQLKEFRPVIYLKNKQL